MEGSFRNETKKYGGKISVKSKILEKTSPKQTKLREKHFVLSQHVVPKDMV